MDTLGPYRILEAIGQGGMGTVWRAEHSELGQHVAIKILRPEYCANYTVVHRFFNEARAACMVADPGIVQIFDFGQVDGRAFIVMELLRGEPLDARLKRLGRLATPDVLRLMIQVAASLHAVHATGIIHRDLKPENIFIVGDPSVTGGERTKLLDFGIAKLSDEQSTVKTRTGVVIGTPVYMSPEQCRGNSELDHRSDIYSFGCVLFTILCGRPPFESQGSGDLIIKHVCDPVPLPSTFAPIPPSLEALVLRCLAKAPADRFQSMAEVIQALAAVGTELASASGPRAWSKPGTQPPPIRNTPSPTTLGASVGQSETLGEPPARRVGWIAGAVASVGIVAGGIYVFGFSGSSPSLDATTTHISAPARELPAADPEPAKATPEPPKPAPAPTETKPVDKPVAAPVVEKPAVAKPAIAKPAVVQPKPVAQPKPVVKPAVVAQPKPAVVVQPKPAPVKPTITDRGD